MSKKLLVFCLVLLTLLLAGGVVCYLVSQKNVVEPEVISPFSEEIKASPSPAEKFKTYTDEAGFIFNYSDSLIISEEENQDKNTYSSLKIVSRVRPGEEMSFKVSDTVFSSIDEWLKNNRKSDWEIHETVLGEINGKLIKKEGKLSLAAIKENIIFLLELPSDTEGYWEKQLGIIKESFKLNLENQKSSSTSGGGGDIEEIIE